MKQPIIIVAMAWKHAIVLQTGLYLLCPDLNKLIIFEGGCGRLLSVECSLQETACPARVFTLQLGWQREQENSADIQGTMCIISEVLHPMPVTPPHQTLSLYTHLLPSEAQHTA